jgi:hypothetical protein
VRLVATTTALLTREGTHPALLQLFAQAAQTSTAPPAGSTAPALPQHRAQRVPDLARGRARHQGRQPFLQRYLPFWLANLVERMWLVLGIIIAVLLPLSRIVPPLYAFRIRSRVFRWYAPAARHRKPRAPRSRA